MSLHIWTAPPHPTGFQGAAKWKPEFWGFYPLRVARSSCKSKPQHSYVLPFSPITLTPVNMTRVEKTYQQDVLRRRDIVVRGSLQADPFIQNDPQVHLTRWCWATSQKGSGSIPDGVIEIIHLLDPFGSGMALGSTQPLTEISFFFPVALRPNAGHGLLILEVSRSHTTMQHSR